MSRKTGSVQEEGKTMELAMQRTVLGVALAVTIAGLTGCGANLKPVTTTVQGTALRGKVFGGQNPVNKAVIQLYAVGTTGYASAATPLITPGSVQTKADGSFSISGDYTCPTLDTLVYMTATGGNSGYVTDNANLTLMSALGTCGNLLITPFVEINEITTVGSVWALAPFMSGPANVGASSTNGQGIANAFADVNVLVNIGQGTTPGPALPAGATFSTGEVNALADILAACINSAGGVANDGSTCGTLFQAANTGTPPTDVVTAAVTMAQNPGLNVATLFGLVVPTSPFLPAEAQPNDFTLAVNFTAGAMSSPSALAADASGNIWITNAAGNTVTELSHTGAVLSGTGFVATLNNPSAIAFDLSGVAWITNKGNNTISLMNDGVPAGVLSNGGLNVPSSIAFDFFGNAWIANTGTTSGTGSVSEFNSGGTAISSDGYTGSGISNPIGIAVNPH